MRRYYVIWVASRNAMQRSFRAMCATGAKWADEPLMLSRDLVRASVLLDDAQVERYRAIAMPARMAPAGEREVWRLFEPPHLTPDDVVAEERAVYATWAAPPEHYASELTPPGDPDATALGKHERAVQLDEAMDRWRRFWMWLSWDQEHCGHLIEEFTHVQRIGAMHEARARLDEHIASQRRHPLCEVRDCTLEQLRDFALKSDRARLERVERHRAHVNEEVP